jgi:hypothetical protein
LMMQFFCQNKKLPNFRVAFSINVEFLLAI